MAWVGFDIETSGELQEYALQPWRVKDRQGWIRTWVEASATGNYAAAPPSYGAAAEQLTEMLQRWADTDTTVCAWNASFEISWLAGYVDHDLLRKVRWLDGMLLWRHLENAPEYDTAADKRRNFGLKACVADYLPQYAGYDDDVDFDGALLPLLHYNACDAWFTRALTKHFYDKLAVEPARLRAALIESHSLVDIGLANYFGVDIDDEGLTELDTSLHDQVVELEARLKERGATPKVLASPKQLAGLLFEDWGLSPLKYGKTGPSTDKETLYELSLIDARVDDIRAYREAKNNRTKFVTNIRASVEYNNDRRSHPSAKIFGTYSGRLTYGSSQGKGKNKRQTGWAIHQMKRAADFRNMVEAPDGHLIIEFDAAGQEFRWMALLSGDPTMLSLCMPGGDPHAYMGAQVASIPYDEVKEGAKAEDPQLKAVRQLGKVANLSLQYRTSAKKLLSVSRTQYKMDMRIAMAEKVHRTYRRTYPGVPRYWQRQIQHITRYRSVSTLAGRKVAVSKRMLSTQEWSVQSTSINYPVQGTGADQKYLAMSVLRPVLARYGVRFLFDLHDGLYFIAPVATAEPFIADAGYLLDNLPYKKAWGYQPTVPMTFDCKVGTTWGNMKERT